jgi:hypothetical protein
MAPTCSECGASTSGRVKSGLCRPCGLRRKNQDPAFVAKRRADMIAFNRSRKQPRPHCECGVEISLHAKRCRPCSVRVALLAPEAKAKGAASLSRKHRSDPEFHERHKLAAKRGLDRHLADPANRAKLVELGRRTGPINVRHTQRPEARAKARISISNTLLAHIPADLRALYRALESQKLTAAEREVIVLDHAETERQRAPRLVREAEQQMRDRAEQRQREQY